jgi:hypothetical protein
MKKFISFFLLIILAGVLNSQSVSVNNDGSQPNGRSILDIKSSDKGVLLPRMTSAQRNAIQVVPGDAGLMVFDTDKQSLYIYTGMNWRPLPFTTENEVYPVNYTAPDSEEGDSFGQAVAIYGNYAVVAAPYDDINANTNQGSVYVFFYTGNGWVFQQKLTASDGTAEDVFGISVSIWNDQLAVGASGADIAGQSNRGAVYMFKLNGNQWQQQAKLLHGDPVAGDEFGKAVAIQNNKLLVGAPRKSNGSFNQQGAAYLFLYNGSNWTQNNKLLHGELTGGDEFGSSVAVDANRLVIGAPDKRENNISLAGAAFIFYSANGNSGWSLEKKLTNTTSAFEDRFGSSVSIDGEHVAIGVPGRHLYNSDAAGAVIIYRYIQNDWLGTASLDVKEVATEDYFGSSVALKGAQLLVGAPMRDIDGHFNAGGAWLFEGDLPFSSWFFRRRITDVEVERIAFFGSAVAVCKVTGRYIIGSRYANQGKGRIAIGTLP